MEEQNKNLTQPELITQNDSVAPLPIAQAEPSNEAVTPADSVAVPDAAVATPLESPPPAAKPENVSPTPAEALVTQPSFSPPSSPPIQALPPMRHMPKPPKLAWAVIICLIIAAVASLFILKPPKSTPQVNNQATQSSQSSLGDIKDESVTFGIDTKIANGKTLTATGSVVIQNEVNSVDAFKVQNATGDNLLSVDTQNGKVGINGTPTASGAALQVSGDINATGVISSKGTVLSSGGLSADNGATTLSNGGLTINSVLICTSGGCKTSGLQFTGDAVTLNGKTSGFYTNASNLNSGKLSDGLLSTNVDLLDASQTVSGNKTFTGINSFTAAGNTFNGDGSGLSALNASNISSGTLNDSRLSANVTLQGNTFNGANQLVMLDSSGFLPILNASALTNLNASAVSIGTLNDARLSTNVTLQGNTFNGANQLVQVDASGNLPALSGINLTNLNASNITAGTLNDLRLGPNVTLQGNTFNGASQLIQTTSTSFYPALNGSLITNINASNISSGTLSDGRLSTNVALLGATSQTFTGANSFSSAVSLPGITPSGSNLAIGGSGASLNLQGNLSSSLAVTNGTNTITVGFNGTPTANITYNFDNTAAAGTYAICTTAGNCAGIGGTVTTSGGTANKLPKFTGSQTIGNSSITDNGTNVTVTEPGLFQNVANSLTAFQIQDAAGTSNLFVADTTDTRIAIAKASASYTLDVGGSIGGTSIYQNGNQVCDTSGNCVGSGSAGSAIGGSGTANTIALFTGAGTIGNSTLSQSGSTVSGTNLNVTGMYQVNGSQIASANLSDSSNLAKLNGTGPQTFTGNNKFTGTVVLQPATDSTTAFTVNNAAGTSTVLNVDTTNKRVGIGTVAPSDALTVSTNVNDGGITLQGASSGGTTPTFKIADSSGTVYARIGIAGAAGTLGAGSSSDDLVIRSDSNKNILLAPNANTGLLLSGTNGSALFRNFADSTTAFQIQNAAGTSNLFMADTTNGRIGIGKAPGYMLDVNGDVNIATGASYRINGVAICGPSATCAPASGSSNYIQNSVALQTNANFNIESVSAASVVGILRGASGQTADLLRAQDGTGANVFTVGANGNVNTTGLYQINGTTICTSGGCTAASGSGNYIQNGNTPQAASYNITGTATIGTDNSTALKVANSAGSSALSVDTTNLGVNVTNLQASGTIALQGPDGGSILLHTAANSGTGSNAMTFSGNEITDATRSANTQGDGRQPPDSSTGIWESTTNLVTNGGFESNTTSWAVNRAGVISRDTSTAKFGSASLKLVADGSQANQTTQYNSVSITSGQSYTISFWAKADSARTIVLGYQNGSGEPSTTFSATATWTRFTYTYMAAGSKPDAFFEIGLNGTQAGTLWLDGVQEEQKAVATPYVDTNGVTATRGAARVQAPASNLNVTQGWVAFRFRPGWSSSTPPATFPALFAWGDNNQNYYEIYFTSSGGSKIAISRGSGGSVDTDAQPITFNAGDLITVVAYWTASGLGISFNGGAFGTNAGSHVPAIANTLADIGTGTSVGDSASDADFKWFSAGTGTLSSADAAALYKQGNSDPSINSLNSMDSASSPTFAWDGEGTGYSGTNNSPTLQSGISIDDVNLYHSSNGSIAIQGSTNSTTAFQVQDSAGAGLLIADTTNHTVIAKGQSGQTADLLQLQDSSGNVLDKFNSSGNLQVGTTGSGAVTAGTVQSGGTGSNLFLSASSTGYVAQAIGGVAQTQLSSSGFLVKPTNNSTTAFVVNNSSGSSVLGVDTVNQQVNLTNLQASGTIALQGSDGGSILLRAAANSGTGSNAMTFSGNEITDATRSADTQGDGRQPPDSSTGIWESTTNLVTNGGFESNTTNWGTQGTGTITAAQDTSTAKFGAASLKVVTDGSSSSQGAKFGSTSRTSVSSSTAYTWSFWAKGSGTITPSINEYTSGGTYIQSDTGAATTLTGSWQRLTYTFTTTSTTAGIISYALTNSAQSDTFWIDGVQLEQKAFATPYVETNGATATRSAARVRAPVSNLNATQGWFATRFRAGMASSNTGSIPGGGMDFADLVQNINTNKISLNYSPTGFHMDYVQSSNQQRAAITTLSFNAGDLITVVGYWTSSTLGISVNGSNFTTAARTNPNISPTSLDFGSQAGAQNFADSDILWTATGTGTLTNADAASLYGLGNSDPTLTGLNSMDSASAPTFAWDGESSQYSGTNNTPTLQSGISIDDVNLYHSANGSISIQGATNSTAAFQVQNASGTSVFDVDTTNGRVGIGTSSPSKSLTIKTTTAQDGILVQTAGANQPTISLSDTVNNTSGGLRLAGGSSNIFQVGGSSGTSTPEIQIGSDIFGAAANPYLDINTTRTALMNGSVGIGTTNPQSALALGSDAGTAASGIKFGSAGDTDLYRSAAGALKTDGSLTVNNGLTVSTSAGNAVVVQGGQVSLQNDGVEADLIGGTTTSRVVQRIRLNTDTQPRLSILANGQLNWGDGTNATDTDLYRSAANTLQTDSNFALNGGTLTINGYTLQATPTSYGSLALTTTHGGYYGLLMGPGTSNANIMYDTSGNGGIYYQNTGVWEQYYTASTNHLNINTSSDLGYNLGVSGSLGTTGNATIGGTLTVSGSSASLPTATTINGYNAEANAAGSGHLLDSGITSWASPSSSPVAFTVSFGHTYSSAPVVTATLERGYAGDPGWVNIYNVTTTGFTAYAFGTVSGSNVRIHWMAEGN